MQVFFKILVKKVLEVPNGFEPMVTELQSVALPTWLRNHNNPLREIYYSNQKKLMQLLFQFFSFL